jgi:hypothetical protein
MTSVRRGKADIAAASAISRSLLSWAAHHPIPCTTRIVNAALDIALALRRMPASGPEKTLIELFAVVADDRGNQATLAAEGCDRSSSAPSTLPSNRRRNANIADMLKAELSWTKIQNATGCSRATIAKLAKRLKRAA